MKDIKKDEDINQEQQKTTKLTLEEAEKDMKSILKNYQDNDEIWKKDLAIMQDKHETENIYLAYLKLAADDSQANVSKRLELFQELLEKGFQSLKFQTAWK